MIQVLGHLLEAAHVFVPAVTALCVLGNAVVCYRLYRLVSQETHLNIASYLASAQELMYAPNSQWKQSYKGSEPPVISK